MHGAAQLKAARPGLLPFHIRPKNRLALYNRLKRLADRPGPAPFDDSAPAGYSYLRPKKLTLPPDEDAGLCIIPALQFAIGERLWPDLRKHLIQKNTGKKVGIGMALVNKWISERSDEIDTRMVRIDFGQSFYKLLQRTQGMYVMQGTVSGQSIGHWYAFDAWKGVLFLGHKDGVVVLEEHEREMLKGNDGDFCQRLKTILHLQQLQKVFAACEVHGSA